MACLVGLADLAEPVVIGPGLELELEDLAGIVGAEAEIEIELGFAAQLQQRVLAVAGGLVVPS